MATRILTMTLRLLFLVMLVLGILFWTGKAGGGLVLLHMFLGIVFVAVFWAIGIVQAMGRNGSLGLTLGTFILGLVIAIYGLAQRSLLPGSGHWIIQVIHLLLALIAIGMAEMIAGRTRRKALADVKAA